MDQWFPVESANKISFQIFKTAPHPPFCQWINKWQLSSIHYQYKAPKSLSRCTELVEEKGVSIIVSKLRKVVLHVVRIRIWVEMYFHEQYFPDFEPLETNVKLRRLRCVNKYFSPIIIYNSINPVSYSYDSTILECSSYRRLNNFICLNIYCSRRFIQ